MADSASDDDKSLPATRPAATTEDAGAGVERIERHQVLRPGLYWRARNDIYDADDGTGELVVPKGQVLLLRRIKTVDDKPHHVEMQGHPLSSYTSHAYLIDDFLANFDFEENGPAVRAAEMQAVRTEIEDKQKELLEFQSSPAKLLELVREAPALKDESEKTRRRRSRSGESSTDVALPETTFDFEAGLPDGSIRPSTSIVDAAAAAGSGAVSAERLNRQLNNQAILAKRRADWILAKTGEIAETAKKLTPFFEEQGAAALASAEDALEVFKKLTDGLHSLGLYTGKEVSVTPVREDGEEASPEEPITVMQAKLFMDEESLIHVHEGGADFKHFDDFVQVLKTDDAMLQRIAPAPRCVVAMQFTRESRDYEGTDDRTREAMNLENQKFFLVVRNGSRVSLVRSSIEFTDRLFPSASDLERPFKKGFFSGIESERITIDDIQYADAKSRYDRIILHYRKLLIMLAGLIDREPEVIGRPAALADRSGLSLLSLPMQEACFRYISDEENALTLDRKSFREWVREKNKATQSGSRIMANWFTLMTSYSAPGAVKAESHRHGARDYFAYKPSHDYGVVIVSKVLDDLQVKVAVAGTSWGRDGMKERAFDATVSLGLFQRHGSDHGNFGYLCMDDVTLEEINHYIYTRNDRHDYIKYVPLLIEARNAIQADLEQEAPLRSKMAAAMVEGKVCASEASAQTILNEVIRQWRAAHRGRRVPSPGESDWDREMKSMLDQAWILAGFGRDRKTVAEELCREEGREPLRLVLSGKNRLYLYATSTDKERCDTLGKHPWVTRITLDELKTKVSVVDRRQVMLKKDLASETTLASWPTEADWVDLKPGFELPYEEVLNLDRLPEIAAARIESWLTPKDDLTLESGIILARNDTRARSSGRVTHGNLFIPAGILQIEITEEVWRGFDEKKLKKTRYEYRAFGFCLTPFEALYLSASSDSQREEVVRRFASLYQNPESNVKRFKSDTRVSMVTLKIDAVPGLTGKEIVDGEHFNLMHWFEAGKNDFTKLLGQCLKKIAENYSGSKKVDVRVLRRFDDIAERFLQSTSPSPQTSRSRQRGPK